MFFLERDKRVWYRLIVLDRELQLMLDKTYLDSASLVKIGFIQHELQFSISYINLYQTLIQLYLGTQKTYHKHIIIPELQVVGV